MPYDKDPHHRRSIRLKGYDYASCGMYFVTICTLHHDNLLGEIADGRMTPSRWGSVAEECWNAIPDHYPDVTLHAAVVMPNHDHGIIVINDRSREIAPTDGSHGVSPRSLGVIVRAYKATVTRQINRDRSAPGAPLWQRNYWEHIIRNEKALAQIRTYIISNPTLWREDRLNPANYGETRR